MNFPFVRGPRARELPYINKLQRAERILTGFDLLTGKITPEEAFRFFRERIPPLGSGLGVTREEAFEEMEGILKKGLSHQCQTGLLQLYKLLADRKMELKDLLDDLLEQIKGLLVISRGVGLFGFVRQVSHLITGRRKTRERPDKKQTGQDNVLAHNHSFHKKITSKLKRHSDRRTQVLD